MFPPDPMVTHAFVQDRRREIATTRLLEAADTRPQRQRTHWWAEHVHFDLFPIHLHHRTHPV